MEHVLSSLTAPGDPRWTDASPLFVASETLGLLSMHLDGTVVSMSESLRLLCDRWELDTYSIHPWLQGNLNLDLSLYAESNGGAFHPGKIVSRLGVIPVYLQSLPPGEHGVLNWNLAFPRLLLDPAGYELFISLEVCHRSLALFLQSENPPELLESLGNLLWHLLPADASMLLSTAAEHLSMRRLAGTCSYFSTVEGAFPDAEFWQSLPANVFYRQRLSENDRSSALAALMHDADWKEILIFCCPGWGVLLVGFSHSTLGETAARLLIDSLASAWKATCLRQAQHLRFRQLDQAVQQSAASIVITDTEGRIQFVNPAFSALTGYSLEECIGENPRLLKSQFTQPEVYEEMWADLLQKNKWSGVFCNRKKNGDLYWESAVISPIINDAGEITHFVAVKENITDKIAAELQAKQKANLLEEIMSSLPGVLLVVDHDKQLLHWNKNLERVTGLSASELNKLEVSHLFPAHFRYQCLTQIQRLFAGQSFDPFEVEIVHANQKSNWFYLTSVPLQIDHETTAMVVGIDITDRKKLREQIKDQGVRYSAILDQVTDAISLIDQTGKSIFNTPSVFRMYGYTPEEMTGIDLFTLLHPDDVSMARDKYRQMITEGWPSARVEVRVQHKDGFYLMVDTVGVNLLDDPAVGAILLSSRDITQKQKAAEILENERRQLHTLMDSIPDSIYIKDLHARKLIANVTDRSIMNLPSELDFVGKTDLDLYPYEVGIKGYSDDIFVLSTGNAIHDREEVFYDSQGQVKWLLTSKVPLRNTSGVVTGVLGIGRDITQRKLAVDEIRASNERFELLSRATFDVVWDMEIATQKLVWSDNYEAQFGHSISHDEKENYRSWLAHIHPEDLNRVQASFEHALASGQELWREQYRFRKVDQQYAFIRDRGILVRDLKGNPVRMIGAMQDVTREHDIQEKLLQAERRFRVLIENSSDGTVLLNANLEPIYLSPSVERLLGYNLAEDKLINIANLIHPDDLEYVIDWQRRVMEQPGIPQEGLSRIRHKNGTWRWKSSTITNLLHVPQVGGIVENFKDVTEQVEVERAVLAERDLSNSIINSLPGIFYLRQLNGKMLRWNRDLIRISGYSEAELSEINPIDLYVESDQLKLKMLLNRYPYLESTGLELRLHAKDGTQVPLFVNLHAIDYEGEPCIVAVGIDISDRKRAEAENKKLGMIASLTINAVILTDTSGRITWVNQGFERMTGYSFEEVNGQIPGNLLQGAETDPATVAMMRECFTQVRGYKTEVLNYTKRGEPYWVEIEVVPLFDEQNKHTGYMAMERDITERRDTEVQMKSLNQNLRRQTEDLASSNEELERFAYVASHDLQEPLRMVSGFLNLLKTRYGPHFDETGLQYIDFAVNGASRMKQLIIDLLNYSRVGTDATVPEPVDLNELISELRVIFQKEISDLNAVINAVNLPVVIASRMQMFQLMQNLIGNSLKYRSERSPIITISAKQLETEWEISVADNGIGMETQYLDRIFIIFQRLHGKDEYGGTGIGLTICKKIVEKHGGRIWAESVPNEGSTFIFRLPQEPLLKSSEIPVLIPKVDL